MLGRLRSWLRTWLGVPAPAPADADDGPLPPGLYLIPPGTILTGYEPLSAYRAWRVGDADHVILRYGP